MHSSPIATLPLAFDCRASAAAAPKDRHSGPRLVPTRANPEEDAERELASYFARTHDAVHHGADDEAVEATLASISAYHRGVLTLYYSARTWPDGVKQALGKYAAIGIRLDCADHPAVGSTPTLEQAAARRIAAIFAAEGHGAATLVDLHIRAMDHHRRALRSYAKALATRRTPWR